jgi:glycosyltransferase involved in cell wall biosynthesis
MNFVQLTPGAGGMYCGNCLRDNALVGALRRLGHDALMVPLYLPLTLDEQDLSRGMPVFFSGVNVYLDQKTPWFRRAPRWLRRWLSGRRLLRWVGRLAAKTRAEEVGELTLSMLRGESGHQARDLEELVAWLRKRKRPDVFCLSNALLMGLAEKLETTFAAPVVCLLSGEDAYIDEMPEPWRREVWALMADRARTVRRFIAPSHYFARRMAGRLKVPRERVSVAPPGINLEGYPAEPPPPPEAPTIGYLARMGPLKGLDTLVEAFLQLRQSGRVADARLKVAGGCGPGDEPFVRHLRRRLAAAGCADAVSFHPNLERAEKVGFLRSLSVFSVPALYGEAFGLYLVEAMAAGVPVAQPRHAAFPELIEATGGGVLCEPGSVASLAAALEGLLRDEPRRRALGARGQEAVRKLFSAETAARSLLRILDPLIPPRES